MIDARQFTPSFMYQLPDEDAESYRRNQQGQNPYYSVKCPLSVT